MHSSSSTLRRAALGVAGGLPLLVGAVGLAGPAAGAAAVPPNATVAIGANGLVYTGLAGANDVTVKLAGSRYVLTDTAPITAGAGCSAASALEVHCQVPLNPNGTVRSFRVDSGAGDDRVRNLSSAPMRASGNVGNDVLQGGPAGDLLTDSFGKDVLRGNGGDDSLSTDLSQADGLPDTLEGGSGSDDLRSGPNDDVLRGQAGNDTMRGGLGADTFDGGSGSEDAVVYLDNGHVSTDRNVISIDGKADDGVRPLGASTSHEKDNVQTSVERVFGGHGPDVIFGSELANLLHGNLGPDVIEGGLGADTIDGGPGNDTLASNQLFGVPVADGALDTVKGNSDTDYCRVPFPTPAEQDVTVACETVDQD